MDESTSWTSSPANAEDSRSLAGELRAVTMPSDVAQRLATYWGQSLSSRRGASSEALLGFEARHSVKLPSDMRDYLLHLDGTGASWPDDQDPKGFSFWQLTQIRPVNDELASNGLSALPGLERYFVFA